MESKRNQLSKNFRELSKALQERNPTAEAELVAIAEKLLQCYVDVKSITVRAVESKREQLFENFCDLSKAVHERVRNKTTTDAELDAIAEKVLQCSIDVMAITVRPLEGEGSSEEPSKAEAKP